jgi:hypothetical protein
MIKAHWAAALAVACLSTGVFAEPENPAGTVKNMRGNVLIERAGQKTPATVGAPLFAADRLRTGADGSVGVTLRDNTLLSAGPNSLISLEKFAFDSTTNAGAMSIGVKKGTLSVASGKIAKQTPESVDFHTPTTMLGVRGTEFVIEVGSGSDE